MAGRPSVSGLRPAYQFQQQDRHVVGALSGHHRTNKPILFFFFLCFRRDTLVQSFSPQFHLCPNPRHHESIQRLRPYGRRSLHCPKLNAVEPIMPGRVSVNSFLLHTINDKWPCYRVVDWGFGNAQTNQSSPCDFERCPPNFHRAEQRPFARPLYEGKTDSTILGCIQSLAAHGPPSHRFLAYLS